MSRNMSKKLLRGTIEIKIKDENGTRMFDWRANSGKNNIEIGVYEMMKFFREKMAIDMVNYLESHKDATIKLNNDTTDNIKVELNGTK
jgi:hypothetical protein